MALDPNTEPKTGHPQRVWIAGSDAAGAATGVAVVGGPAADDAAASGNPVPVGGKYNTALPTYTDGDRTQLQTDAGGRVLAVASGNVASGATDSGNPVKVAGVYNTAPPTLTNGQRGDLQFDTRSSPYVVLKQANGTNAVEATVINADSISAAGTVVIGAKGYGFGFNGTSWDRNRQNTDITALASAARTATLNSGDLTNYNGRGLHVVLDCTTAGTGSITITIQGKDALSGQYYTILAGAAVTSISTNVYRVYPGLTAAANAVASDILPRTYRILITHNNANSITYSVGASIIL